MVMHWLYFLVTVSWETSMSKAACDNELQVLGRQLAELASSDYLLLQSSLPRMAARVCFLLEGSRRLSPALNSLMVKTDAHFLHAAQATQVGCNDCLCVPLFWV